MFSSSPLFVLKISLAKLIIQEPAGGRCDESETDSLPLFCKDDEFYYQLKMKFLVMQIFDLIWITAN